MTGYPMSFLLDERQRVVGVLEGWTEEIQAEVMEFLAEAGPAAAGSE